MALEITDRELLFFMFLTINRFQSPAGIMPYTHEALWAEFRRKSTSVKDVATLLESLQSRGRILCDQGWLWVINAVKHRREWNPMVGQGIRKVLNRVTSRAIYDGWWKRYKHYTAVAQFVGETVFCGDPAAPEPEIRVEIEAIPKTRLIFDGMVKDIWSFYCDVMDVKRTLTETHRVKILRRLQENITDPATGEVRKATVEDCFRAIRACSESDWHMGREGKGPYNDLAANILRDQGQFERWLAKAAGLDLPRRAAKKAKKHDDALSGKEGSAEVTLR